MRSDGRSSKTANIMNVKKERIRLSGTPTLPQEFMPAMPPKADTPEPTRVTQCDMQCRNQQTGVTTYWAVVRGVVRGSTGLPEAGRKLLTNAWPPKNPTVALITVIQQEHSNPKEDQNTNPQPSILERQRPTPPQSPCTSQSVST